MTPGERALAAARATVGARFRPQGRDPALGLDCVGVAAVALTAGGCTAALPRDYALRSARWRRDAVPAGVVPADGARPGDILLCRVSAAQLHLAVRSARGIIHAEAAQRRVVERPGAPPWPIVAAWRIADREG